ncbi:putative phage membrane protein [Streptococcus iniae SF1]|nr:putative phage membrane protein [Streptococcus iniae SF1]
MRAITRLALVVAIAILYVPISLIALIVYPFFNKEK